MRFNYSTDTKDAVNNLIKKNVSWLSGVEKPSSIVISTRIRLARNLTGYPFPCRAKKDQRREILDIIGDIALSLPDMDKALAAELHRLPKIDKQVLFERHLISREHKTTRKTSGVVISPCETCSIMINEEDHLRLQVMKSGLELQSVWSEVDKLDDGLSQNLNFAYHREFGYLTSCPTNVGTGLRASVMLHLPALVFNGQINSVIRALSKMGLTVRGLFGEGSESVGNLFQVSNQTTLGISEAWIIARLENIINRIVEYENNARKLILESRANELYDYIGRSYGALSHTYLIDTDEAMIKLSAVRLGIDLGMFSYLDITTINDLVIKIQPGHLQKHFNAKLRTAGRDRRRAELIRGRINQKSEA